MCYDYRKLLHGSLCLRWFFCRFQSWIFLEFNIIHLHFDCHYTPCGWSLLDVQIFTDWSLLDALPLACESRLIVNPQSRLIVNPQSKLIANPQSRLIVNLRAHFLSSLKTLATIFFQLKSVKWHSLPWFWRQISLVKNGVSGSCYDRKSAVKGLPGDSKWWESPDDVDIVWRLFIQILFR